MKAGSALRSPLALVLPALLAACGSSDSGAAAGSGGDATLTATAAQDCGKLPAFVALAEGAAIAFCFQKETEPGHSSGTVMYTTSQAPSAVIEFYRAKAKAAGIPDSLSNTAPEAGMGPMYSARDGTRRSFMAITKPLPDGKTEVTLNWGMDH